MLKWKAKSYPAKITLNLFNTNIIHPWPLISPIIIEDAYKNATTIIIGAISPGHGIYYIITILIIKSIRRRKNRTGNFKYLSVWKSNYIKFI